MRYPYPCIHNCCVGLRTPEQLLRRASVVDGWSQFYFIFYVYRRKQTQIGTTIARWDAGVLDIVPSYHPSLRALRYLRSVNTAEGTGQGILGCKSTPRPTWCNFRCGTMKHGGYLPMLQKQPKHTPCFSADQSNTGQPTNIAAANGAADTQLLHVRKKGNKEEDVQRDRLSQ